MEATILGLIVSAILPKLLELLKSRRWAPFINHYSPWVNRTTAVAISFITAVGVTVNFDAAAGELTVTGLLPDQVLQLGLTWLLNFAMQEAVYRRFVNTPSSVPPAARRGGLYLIPILLSVGLSAAGCAGKSKALATQVDGTVYTVLSSIQAGADALVMNKVITVETRRELAPHLLKALRLGDSYNRAVRAGSVFEALPALLEALRVLKVEIAKLVPGAAGGALLADVDRAISLVPAGGQ